MTKRRTLLNSLVATAALAFAGIGHGALAQDKLDLATIVVGFPPGGATDTVARLIAEGLNGTYADAVVVENRPGTGGQVAAN